MSPPEEEEEENSSREKKGTRMEYRSLIFPDENPNDSVSSANNFETFEWNIWTRWYLNFRI